MSIFLEFLHSFFVALLFEFIVYATGAVILRIVSFGSLKVPIYSLGEFKELKEKSRKGLITPSVIGFLFYLLIIVVVAWFN